MHASIPAADGWLTQWRRWTRRHATLLATLLLALCVQDIAGLTHFHPVVAAVADAASATTHIERTRLQHTADSHNCSLCQVLAQGSAPPPRITLLRHAVFAAAERAPRDLPVPPPTSLRSHSWQGRAPPLI